MLNALCIVWQRPEYAHLTHCNLIWPLSISSDFGNDFISLPHSVSCVRYVTIHYTATTPCHNIFSICPNRRAHPNELTWSMECTITSLGLAAAWPSDNAGRRLWESLSFGTLEVLQCVNVTLASCLCYVMLQCVTLQCIGSLLMLHYITMCHTGTLRCEFQKKRYFLGIFPKWRTLPPPPFGNPLVENFFRVYFAF